MYSVSTLAIFMVGVFVTALVLGSLAFTAKEVRRMEDGESRPSDRWFKSE